jgi:bacillaene synthase trans-acting acyltransferase
MLENKTVFMFSGQGSQYYQMGRELFENNSAFRHHLHYLNRIATGLLDLSLIDVLYAADHKKSDRFDRTLLSCPAIFSVECALALTLIDSGVEPDLLLGASMGLHASIAIANCLNIDDSLRVLIEEARLLENLCERGSMLAVLAKSRVYSDDDVLRSKSEIASLNYTDHFVVSTKLSNVGDIKRSLNSQHIAFSDLPVSLAFHSRWIDPAESDCLTLLSSLSYKTPQIPVVCCGQARSLTEITAGLLWDSVRKTIDFERTILQLEISGPHRYIDVGPMGTLATFLKRLLSPNSKSSVCAIMTPFGNDLRNFEQLLSSRV